MESKPKLLIIEDEQSILTGLIDIFVFHGFTVESSMDGRQGLNMALAGDYDAILLDVMLPSLDGFSICNEIRSVDKEQPIIMLTAKNSDDDIVTGLKLGADDYVSKPFSVEELVLRVKAVIRRSADFKDDSSELVVADGITIDTRNLISTNNPQLEFTRKEIDILRYLKRNSDRPVSREELLDKVWGYEKASNIETRTVDIHIAKIRRKIEKDPKNPLYLVTFRGEGYKLLDK